MPRERITIKRLPGRDVVFDGELVAEATGACDQPDTHGRCHEISVYRRVDGMWIVRIEFHTTSLHEAPHVDVEVVDRPDEVEAVLLLYGPLEHIDPRQIRHRYEADKQRFLKTIRSAYDALADRIIAELRPHLDEYCAGPAVEPSCEPQPSRGWRGFLNLLGVR